MNLFSAKQKFTKERLFHNYPMKYFGEWDSTSRRMNLFSAKKKSQNASPSQLSNEEFRLVCFNS
jgi:hypothetical protein